jgi:hypothetical protein
MSWLFCCGRRRRRRCSLDDPPPYVILVTHVWFADKERCIIASSKRDLYVSSTRGTLLTDAPRVLVQGDSEHDGYISVLLGLCTSCVLLDEEAATVAASDDSDQEARRFLSRTYLLRHLQDHFVVLHAGVHSIDACLGTSIV